MNGLCCSSVACVLMEYQGIGAEAWSVGGVETNVKEVLNQGDSFV